MQVDKIVSAIVASSLRRERFERACRTATGGREVYRWESSGDGVDSWATFIERYPQTTRPRVYAFGNELLSLGFTLALDPDAPDALLDDPEPMEDASEPMADAPLDSTSGEGS